jgi:hypothetical protein
MESAMPDLQAAHVAQASRESALISRRVQSNFNHSCMKGWTMDRSEVVAAVEKDLEKYMRIMGVPHWRIEVEYGPCPSSADYEAEIERQSDYNVARIFLDPEKIEDRAALYKDIVHELAHIVLSPFDIYRGFCTAGQDNAKAWCEAEQVVWRHAVEQAVINVLRVFGGVKDHLQGMAKDG